jgi:Fur family ferric uptake transcriptional regulator
MKSVRLPALFNIEGIAIMRLSDMRQGQTARIIAVNGDPGLRRRLLEMGLIRGAEVYIEKYAPLKDPLELIVKGYHVSLRVKEAAEIKVVARGEEGRHAEQTA